MSSVYWTGKNEIYKGFVVSLEVFQEIEHFSPIEFAHPEKLNPDLLILLDAARKVAGIPFYIKSDYREGDPRAHGDGDGLDFGLQKESHVISGRERYLVLPSLLSSGFHRIGIYDRHFHVDVSNRLPGKVIWMGDSQ